MRLFRVRDLDTLGMVVCMLKSNDDQWVARGARVVGAWCASNHSIQNLILESGNSIHLTILSFHVDFYVPLH